MHVFQTFSFALSNIYFQIVTVHLSRKSFQFSEMGNSFKLKPSSLKTSVVYYLVFLALTEEALGRNIFLMF